jgi:hypothetical protein
MTMYVGVGGVHRAVSAVWVGVGGEWRLVSRADVGVGGEWRLGHSGITLDPTYGVTSSSTAGFRLGADGFIYQITQAGTTNIGQWTTPGDDGSQYSVISTLLSGTLNSGFIGSNTLATDRTWTCLAPAAPTAQIRLDITPFGSGVVLDSTVVTLTSA